MFDKKIVMKKIVELLIFKYLTFNMRRIYGRRILEIMRLNKIPDKPVEGEKEFVMKWQKLQPRVDVNYYRCFSHYIGNDINILPEDICCNIIEPILNPWQYRAFFQDKNMFDKILPQGFLPKTILRMMGGFFYTSDYRFFTSFSDEALYVLLRDYEQFVVKPTVDSCSGEGVFIFGKKDGGVYKNKAGESLSIEYLMEHYGGNCVIQECINQHEVLLQLNPSSVNTLRICTYRSVKTDEIIITNIALRVGNRGSDVDNIHAGGFVFGVSDKGELGHYGVNHLGERKYIFNGIDYKHQKICIPMMDKIRSFAQEIARCVPYHRLLALDIVLDNTGKPCLLEYNIGGFSVWLFQLTTGSVFKEYTDEVIDYCAKHLGDISFGLNINK